MYQERVYRNIVNTEKLISYQILVKETDLLIHAGKKLVAEARELVLEHRSYVERFIKTHPDFMTTLDPWRSEEPAPNIISDMIRASKIARVGPMAAIAGALAEQVGRGLLEHTAQVIVENGGDVFIKTYTPVTVGIFAGASPLNMQVGIRINCDQKPVAVCTSSGTIGHSLSLGRADAVCVVADSCALADAAATSIGNLVQSPADINMAIDVGKKISEITGIVIVAGEKIGVWGDLAITPLTGKKG